MFQCIFSMMGIGTNELLIFAFIALLLFGTRLPKIARSFGESVSEFKKGIHDAEHETEDDEKTEVKSESQG